MVQILRFSPSWKAESKATEARDLYSKHLDCFLVVNLVWVAFKSQMIPPPAGVSLFVTLKTNIRGFFSR